MRNPYHNYEDLEVIDLYTTDIVNSLRNGTLSLPNFNDNEVISEWWYCDSFGMDTYRTKEDIKISNTHKVPTKFWNGKVYPYRYRKKGKLRKNGTPYNRTKMDRNKKGYPIKFDYETKEWIYETLYGEMEYFSKDFQSFCEYYNDHRQISSSLSHNERFVVVGDFDIEKDTNGKVIHNPLVPFNDNTIPILEDICEKYKIPHFTYLEEHTDKGSFQIGWILNETFKWNNRDFFSHRDYINLIHRISVIFGSDKNYKGWLIKNPNYIKDTYTYWFNDSVDKDLLVSSIKTTYYNNFYQKDTVSSNEEQRKTTEQKIHIDKFIDNTNSRNCELFDRLRFWYREYLINNKEYPSFEETYNNGYQISVELGKLTQKGMLGTEEIKRTVQSIDRYFKKNSLSHNYTDRQRVGDYVVGSHKEETIVDIYLLKKEGMKNKDIVSKLGVSKSTVDKGIRFIKDNPNLFSKDSDYNSLIPNTFKLYELQHNQKYKKDCDRIFGKVYKILEEKSSYNI